MNRLDSLIDRANNYFRKRRDCFFAPIVKIFAKCGLSANILSSLKVLLAVVVLFVLNLELETRLGLLLLCFLIDIFDGPLARYRHRQGDRGKFVDIFTDQVLFVLLLLAMGMAGLFNQRILSYTIFILPTLYLLVIIRKNETQASDWIILPTARLSYYKITLALAAYLAVYGYIEAEMAEILFMAANILMTVHGVYTYICFLYANPRPRVKV